MRPKELGPCPCGSGLVYSWCCAGLIDHGQSAPTASALMRSRFTAFALRRPDYLMASWHPRTRPAVIQLDKWRVWVSLEIIRTVAGNAGDQTGTVLFAAGYDRPTGAGLLRELSRFERSGGDWKYVDGVLLPEGLG